MENQDIEKNLDGENQSEKLFKQDELETILAKRLDRERKKQQEELDKLNAKIEELSNEKEAVKTNVEKTAEERIAELTSNFEAMKKEQELTLKQQEEANKRLAFHNKMVENGISPDLAKTISNSTQIDAIDEYDISVLPKTKSITNLNVEDKAVEKGTNTIASLAMNFIK